MASFINDEIRQQRRDHIEETEKRRRAAADAEVATFLSSIDDICQDIRKEVRARYVFTGELPSLVNIICDQATTAVADDQECLNTLLCALQQMEECVTSITFQPFKASPYNEYGRSRIAIYFSWK